MCKVADFGLSKQRLQTYVTGVASLRGTLPWTAPEIIRSPHAVNEKVRAIHTHADAQTFSAHVCYQHVTPCYLGGFSRVCFMQRIQHELIKWLCVHFQSCFMSACGSALHGVELLCAVESSLCFMIASGALCSSSCAVQVDVFSFGLTLWYV